MILMRKNTRRSSKILNQRTVSQLLPTLRLMVLLLEDLEEEEFLLLTQSNLLMMTITMMKMMNRSHLQTMEIVEAMMKEAKRTWMMTLMTRSIKVNSKL